MKRLFYFAIIVVLACLESCIVPVYRNCVRYECHVVNNSQIDILVYEAGGDSITASVYPDTLLPELWRYFDDYEFSFVLPMEDYPLEPTAHIIVPGGSFPVLATLRERYTRREFDSFFPDGYYSVFIIEGQKVIDKGWDGIREDNDIIVRYDLTYDDLVMLDKIIPFPPTEDMKDVKMWPPYDEVVGKYERNITSRP